MQREKIIHTELFGEMNRRGGSRGIISIRWLEGGCDGRGCSN